MGVASFTRARDLLLAADREELPAREVCEEVVRSLHGVTSFSWCALMLTDPRTLLPCGGVVEGFSSHACAPFWDNELLDADFLKFNDLAGNVDPIATLAEVLDGDLDRSPRYRNIYGPLGAADELRIAFVAGTTCVAVGTFVRALADGPFPPDELADVRALVPIATNVLRRGLGRVDPPGTGRAPIVVLLDDEGGVRATTGGKAVLDELGLTTSGKGEPFEHELPSVIRAAASKARWSRTSSVLTTRLHGRDGHWLRLHVSPLDDDPATVVVTIDDAPPHELVRVVLESYGLTPRETDVALLLCRGRAAKEIAAELAISVHTVRDHTKAVYEKANVSGRGELVASLLSTHVLAHLESSVTRLDS